jgi:UDP-N-acetylglucosamine acyltransferase
VILVNTVNLGGHVQVGDHASIGGNTAVHQFVRVGAYAFAGGISGLDRDVPPYMLVSGLPAHLYGPNVIGLKRSGFTPEAILALKRSYRIIFRSGLRMEEALERVRTEVPMLPEVDALIRFVTSSSHRGIMRRSSGNL